MTAPMKVIVTKDGGRVVMAKGEWRQTVAAADLPRWIRLYRGLRDRNAPHDKAGRPTALGPFARFYAADVEALEAAQRKIAAMEDRP